MTKKEKQESPSSSSSSGDKKPPAVAQQERPRQPPAPPRRQPWQQQQQSRLAATSSAMTMPSYHDAVTSSPSGYGGGGCLPSVGATASTFSAAPSSSSSSAAAAAPDHHEETSSRLLLSALAESRQQQQEMGLGGGLEGVGVGQHGILQHHQQQQQLLPPSALSLWSQGNLEDLLRQRQFQHQHEHNDDHHHNQNLMMDFVDGKIPRPPSTLFSSSPSSSTATDAATASARASLLGQFSKHNSAPGPRHQHQIRHPVRVDEDAVNEVLRQLSLEERQRVYRDVFGAANNAAAGSSSSHYEEEEDPNMIQQCLRQFEHELAKILQRSEPVASSSSSATTTTTPQHGGGAALLHVAMSQNPLFVKDTSLQMAFLRAENYNIQGAVERFLGYLQWKMNLFGINKLTKRHITIYEDFSYDEIQALESGCFQIVPAQDKIGRTILINIRSIQQQLPVSHESMLRAMYYVTMSLIEGNDDKVQRQGAISIIYQVGCPVDIDQEFRRKQILLRNVLPLKLAAIHGCIDDPNLRSVAKVIRPFSNIHNFSRIQLHYGNHTEVQIDLMYYGIPVSALPVDSDGNLNFSYHKSWLQQRRIMEREDLVAAQRQSGTATATATRNILAEAPSSAGSQLGSTTKLSPKRAERREDPPRHIARFLHHPQKPPSSPAASSSSSSADGSNTATLTTTPNKKRDRADAANTAAGTAEKNESAAAAAAGAASSSASPSTAPVSMMMPPISQPNPNDCLLGRGKAIDQHVGNCQFRHYIEHHPTLVRAYWNAPKSFKRRIVDQMRMDLQRDLKLRFLKEQDDGLGAWKLADDDAIRHKISRTLRRILQRKQEEQDKLRAAQLQQQQQQQQNQPQNQQQQHQHQQPPHLR